MNEEYCEKLAAIAANIAHHLELAKCGDSLTADAIKDADCALDEYYKLLRDYDNS